MRIHGASEAAGRGDTGGARSGVLSGKSLGCKSRRLSRGGRRRREPVSG